MTDFAARRVMMVDTQVRPSDVTRFPIIDAMLTIRREDFVPSGQREAAYLGDNLPLGPSRVILDPRTFAKMLEALSVDGDDIVLDIGSGLGYPAAILSRLVDTVVAVEEDGQLVTEAEQNLAAAGAVNAALVEGPLTEGAAKAGPYDVILIEGGVEEVPEAITAQLKEGGRIGALFMAGPLGTVRIGHMVDGRITWRDAFNASAPVIPGFERQRDFVL